MEAERSRILRGCEGTAPSTGRSSSLEATGDGRVSSSADNSGRLGLFLLCLRRRSRPCELPCPSTRVVGAAAVGVAPDLPGVDFGRHIRRGGWGTSERSSPARSRQSEERCPKARHRKHRGFERQLAARWSNAKQLKHLPRRSVGTGRRGRYAWRFQRLSTFIQPSASGARATILRPRPSTMRTMRGAIGGGEPLAPAIGAVSRNLHNSAGLTQLPQVSWHGHAQAAIFPQLLASFPPCCPIRCRTRAEALRRAEGHSSFSAQAHKGAAPPKTVISTSCGSSCSSSP